MSEILVILADGFEEAEAVITIDVLRRFNFDVCVASLSENPETASSRNVKIVADKTLSSCKNGKFKAVVLPGGIPGTYNLRDSADVVEIVQKACKEGSLVCAICAAPLVLNHAGLLDNVKFTAYPGLEDQFRTSPTGNMVEHDKNIITGKGVGGTFEFAFKIASALGRDTSELEKAMLLK